MRLWYNISQNAGNDNLLLDLQIESCHLGIRSCRLLLQVAMAALSISPLLTAAFTRRTPSPVLIEHSSNSVNSWILPYKGAKLSLLNLALPLRNPRAVLRTERTTVYPRRRGCLLQHALNRGRVSVLLTTQPSSAIVCSRSR